MSRIKEYMAEVQEQKDDERLAKILGITYDELMQLDHEIHTEQSGDGLVYNYVVEF